jgi:hypothetical protein
MNVHDTVAPTAPGTWAEMLAMIFIKQEQLMTKYRDIEGLPDWPISLHTHSGQKVVKDFAWRTVEELTESYEAWFKHRNHLDAEPHALEELADAMHFFVELMIYAGMSYDAALVAMRDFPIERRKTSSSDGYWQVTFKIGVAMNFLKNKAWKQSQVSTDVGRFFMALAEAHQAMLFLWVDLGYTKEHLFDYYFRKSAVNEFRQRSAY